VTVTAPFRSQFFGGGSWRIMEEPRFALPPVRRMAVGQQDVGFDGLGQDIQHPILQIIVLLGFCFT
jgi:hypothetical protein